MSDYLVITGMSGAGRSTAAAALEDSGWYVIDNMPPSLLSEVAEVVGRPGSTQDRVALVLGRGGGARVEGALPAIDALRAQGHRVQLVYLDAPQDVLVRRFEGTRRRHPILERQVAEAITDERRLLEPVRARADVVVDTAELNVNQLRQRVTELFGDDKESRAAKGKSLDRGITFRSAQTPHDDKARTSGRAYLYFWPGGRTELASIQLRIGDSQEDSEILTLLVAPLTGKVTMKVGPVELKVPIDDVTASDRQDTFF